MEGVEREKVENLRRLQGGGKVVLGKQGGRGWVADEELGLQSVTRYASCSQRGGVAELGCGQMRVWPSEGVARWRGHSQV